MHGAAVANTHHTLPLAQLSASQHDTIASVRWHDLPINHLAPGLLLVAIAECFRSSSQHTAGARLLAARVHGQHSKLHAANAACMDGALWQHSRHTANWTAASSI